MAELHKLPNGMNILLEENHNAPVISLHALVKVGSAVEKKNEAGICHVIEHMLFKGTPTREVGTIARDVEAAGGEINAYTSFDQTVFYINMASRFADKGLDILADAIQNPLFDKDELEKEKEVILEEIRRGNDSPSSRSSELLFSHAFKKHPYRAPIIGFPKTVKAFTRKQLLDFYRRWYTPDNIHFVVVGDFETKEMLKKLNKAFGKFKSKKAPKRDLPKEPLSKQLFILSEENPIFATYFTLGFHIPEMINEDVPAIDVLSHILAGTDSSILEQEVKEKKQLVNAVFSYAYTPKDPGLFIVGGLTSVEKTNAAVKAIWDQIFKLHHEPVDAKDLNRAKLCIRSSEIYEKETTGGLASKYAYYLATADSHSFEENYYRTLNDVTAKDIMRVARKYFVPKNVTAILLNPQGSGKIVNPSEIKAHINKAEKKIRTYKIEKEELGKPKTFTLKNGIKLAILEKHNLPLVSISLAVNGGLRMEDKVNNGINNLLARIITKGTKSRSAVELARDIESIAGAIDGYSGRNSFGIKTDFLSSKLEEGFEIFAETLTSPAFLASEIAKEKSQVIDAIKNQEDALASLAFINFLKTLFPDSPYGMKVLGEKETVGKIGRKQLVDYYNKIINPKNMVISVVGDVSPEEVVKLAEEKLVFKKIKRPALVAPTTQVAPRKELVIEYTRKEKEQAHIVMGFLGPKIKSKDRYAVSVLNNILSGQGGRLFLNLRDRMSLAYAVSSTFFAGIEPGFFAVYIGTEPGKIDTAIAGIKQEFKALLSKGVSEEELKRAKSYLIGSHEMERQRNSNLSGSMAFNILYGLGISEIDQYSERVSKVTRKDILNVAKKYIKPDAPVISVVKPD